jgi:hypothetical protein
MFLPPTGNPLQADELALAARAWGRCPFFPRYDSDSEMPSGMGNERSLAAEFAHPSSIRAASLRSLVIKRAGNLCFAP